MRSIGKIRRSQVISTYGPGAIIDFRSPAGAPISAVSGGLELWEEAKLDHRQFIHEVRLEASLGVNGFHQPPIGEYKTGQKDAKGRFVFEERQLPAVRFPDWHFCPKCDQLKIMREWSQEDAMPDLFCSGCSGLKDGPAKQFVVPVRFVVACENGHLEEFPWNRWVGHKEGCKRKDLEIVAKGAGLSGLWVQCKACGGGKSLGTAFNKGALERIGHSCSGRRPWIPYAHAESCTKPATVIQRGASNGYFPICESAIDIPPFSDYFTQWIKPQMAPIIGLSDPSMLLAHIKEELIDEWDGPHMTARDMERSILNILHHIDSGQPGDLRKEEYAQLILKAPSSNSDDNNFRVAAEIVPETLSEVVGHLLRVERLREVRALTGFTRITPHGQELTDRKPAKLSAEDRPRWLPAIEVFGEGIFVSLNLERLQKWEKEVGVKKRVAALNTQLEQAAKERGAESPLEPYPLTARHILLHTLSHALIQRLSLDCGYSSSSVRERLYAGPEGSEMAGFLVYTSATDADGTLGGLSREGRPERFLSTFLQAIEDTRWCSADPLCSDGLASLFDSGNHAACHSCSFLPETSCEHFNQYLDRALVTGAPGADDLAFFSNTSKVEV
jgi:hypothetical protein